MHIHQTAHAESHHFTSLHYTSHLFIPHIINNNRILYFTRRYLNITLLIKLLTPDLTPNLYTVFIKLRIISKRAHQTSTNSIFKKLQNYKNI